MSYQRRRKLENSIKERTEWDDSGIFLWKKDIEAVWLVKGIFVEGKGDEKTEKDLGSVRD